MAISYVTEDFYTDSFKGTAVPADSLAKALQDASGQVAAACRYKIGDLGNWPDFTQNQVRMAVCEQADYNALYGDAAEALSVFGGYSIGDVSLSSVVGNKGALELHFKLCKKAVEHLMPTGLLDRRIG